MRLTSLLSIFAGISLTACGSSSPPASAPTRATTPTEKAPQAFRERMQHHFAAVTSAQESVVAGSLPDVQTHATSLRDDLATQKSPASWAPYVATLSQAAELAISAETLAAAADATSAMAKACGDCHAAVGAHVEIAPDELDAPPPRKVDDGLSQVMWRHQWAMERMWDALVSPSDALWVQGSAILADDDISEEILPGHGEDEEVIMAVSKELSTHARAAVQASDRALRQAVYGRLLGTCAKCHQAFLDTVD